jgi:hypothetical protein
VHYRVAISNSHSTQKKHGHAETGRRWASWSQLLLRFSEWPWCTKQVQELLQAPSNLSGPNKIGNCDSPTRFPIRLSRINGVGG